MADVLPLLRYFGCPLVQGGSEPFLAFQKVFEMQIKYRTVALWRPALPSVCGRELLWQSGIDFARPTGAALKRELHRWRKQVLALASPFIFRQVSRPLDCPACDNETAHDLRIPQDFASILWHFVKIPLYALSVVTKYLRHVVQKSVRGEAISTFAHRELLSMSDLLKSIAFPHLPHGPARGQNRENAGDKRLVAIHPAFQGYVRVSGEASQDDYSCRDQCAGYDSGMKGGVVVGWLHTGISNAKLIRCKTVEARP